MSHPSLYSPFFPRVAITFLQPCTTQRSLSPNFVSINLFSSACCQLDDAWINLISYAAAESFSLFPETFCLRWQCVFASLAKLFCNDDCDDNVSDAKWHFLRTPKASLENSRDFLSVMRAWELFNTPRELAQRLREKNFLRRRIKVSSLN